MNEPRRLLDEGEPGELTSVLLRSAHDDAPSPEARRRTLAALGLGAGVVAAGTTVTTAAAATGGVGLLKWFGIGVLGGLIVLGGVELTQRQEAATSATANGRSAPAAPVNARTTPQAAAPQERAVEALAGDGARARGDSAAAASPRDLAAPARGMASREADAHAAGRAERLSADAAPRPIARAAAAPAEARRAAAEPTAAAPVAPSLAEEVAVLDRAREALAAGDSSRAFSALDKHDGRFSSGLLGPEAAVMRIEATALRGDAAEARRLANQFFARHPDSPLVGRVRKIVAAARPAPSVAPAATPGGKP